MKARDLMTTDVVTVPSGARASEIARVLLERGVSAVPVIGEDGALAGMVSEGDLIRRGDIERQGRRDWWLAILSEGTGLSPSFIATLRNNGTTARDLMTSPVITVTEDTEAAEIAQLLSNYRIKRVPVMRDGRIVGIVSRADLLRVLTRDGEARRETEPGFFARAIAGLDAQFFHPHEPEKPEAPARSRAPGPRGALKAAEFRALAEEAGHKQRLLREQARRAAAERRQRTVADLIGSHISGEEWQDLLEKARRAAENGEKEFLLLRFPAELCSDGGRAINVAEPGWPATLRGEAAEIYLRWERDLKFGGFHLAAQVLDFPGGMPGDVGLFLIWGRSEA